MVSISLIACLTASSELNLVAMLPFCHDGCFGSLEVSAQHEIATPLARNDKEGWLAITTTSSPRFFILAVLYVNQGAFAI